MMDRKDLIDTLNNLIENCKDGEYGFRRTSEHAQSADLKRTLLARADDCAQGAAELQTVVLQLGGEPHERGTVAGAAHRGWVAVEGVLSGGSDLRMLEEAERGEDTALSRYRDALEKDLPPDVRAIVERQYEGVKRNHAQVRTLRNQARAAKA